MNRLLLMLCPGAMSLAAEPEQGPPPRLVREADGSNEKLSKREIAERIADNSAKAGGLLKEGKTGPETVDLQRKIAEDLKSLIDPPPPQKSPDNPMKSDMPPPPDMKQDMSPMQNPSDPGMPPNKSPNAGMDPGMKGGSQDRKDPAKKEGNEPSKSNQSKSNPGSDQKNSAGSEGNSTKKNSGGNGSRQDRPMSRREQRMQRNGQGELPMPREVGGGPKTDGNEPKKVEAVQGKDPEKKDGDTRAGKAPPSKAVNELADLYREVWGQLPDRMKQEMDLYYREQFMPRYSELLRRYYESIAKQRKPGGEDR